MEYSYTYTVAINNTIIIIALVLVNKDWSTILSPWLVVLKVLLLVLKPFAPCEQTHSLHVARFPMGAEQGFPHYMSARSIGIYRTLEGQVFALKRSVQHLLVVVYGSHAFY